MMVPATPATATTGTRRKAHQNRRKNPRFFFTAGAVGGGHLGRSWGVGPGGPPWRAVVLTSGSVPRQAGHTRHAGVATLWGSGAGGVPQPAVRARNASARWFQQQLVQTSTT